jgi:hypothetical protein
VRWCLTVTLCTAAVTSQAAAQGAVWTPEAEDAHRRADAAHARYIYALHDPDRSLEERRCYDDLASRAGGLVSMLEDRAAIGRIPEWAIEDTYTQLDALAHHADEVCTITRDVDGDTELEVGRSVFAPLMPRDRAVLRLGARIEMIPRVRFAGYGLLPWIAAAGSFGGFVVPWLRVEAIGSFSYMANYGAYGSLGARALVTAPWSLFRIAVGLGASAVLAQDRFGNIDFSWLGVQIELPVELGFELSKDFAITVIGGPMYTQPGQAPASWRAIGGSFTVAAEIVL